MVETTTLPPLIHLRVVHRPPGGWWSQTLSDSSIYLFIYLLENPLDTKTATSSSFVCAQVVIKIQVGHGAPFALTRARMGTHRWVW